MADVKVKRKDLVTVEGTGKSKFIEKNKKVKLHPIAADRLRKAGKVK